MGSRWLLEYQAIDPKNPNGGTWTVSIAERRYRVAQNHGHEKEIARILLVQEVLEGGTSLLYEGWSRPEKDENCYVYAGLPKSDYKSLSIQTPAPKKMYFLVFVLNDGTIDHWTWRRVADGANIPNDITGRLLWPENLISKSS